MIKIKNKVLMANVHKKLTIQSEAAQKRHKKVTVIVGHFFLRDNAPTKNDYLLLLI